MLKYLVSLILVFFVSFVCAQGSVDRKINQPQADMLKPIIKDYIFKVKAIGAEINRIHQRTNSVLNARTPSTGEDLVKTTDNYTFSDVVNNTKYLDSSNKDASNQDLQIEAEIILLNNDIGILTDYAEQLQDTYLKVSNVIDGLDESILNNVLNELGYSVLPVITDKAMAINIENLNTMIKQLKASRMAEGSETD